ncbi:RRXRR domain-containing protein [Hydrocoleum sp. CS-953]|uniref:RRXRR domain-containing protein n=1 Tax=Hydrocoleum sp. CS-953 TaxID=1671698 RepID=UPI000B9A4F6E
MSNTNYLFVIDTNKKPLQPCPPTVARRLLNSGRAAVWRRFPFTLILKKAGANTHTIDDKHKQINTAIQL